MRCTREVISALLEAMHRDVTDYGRIIPPPSTIEGLIDGTAFFPAGCGLWRGEDPHGPLPEHFPETPIMFVGNNWSNEKYFIGDRIRGIESDIKHPTGFWGSFRLYLEVCKIDPRECFMTNALMGFLPDEAPSEGELQGAGCNFRSECRHFFDEQVRIVRPRMIVAMGNHAQSELRDLASKINVPHPSSLRAKGDARRSQAEAKVANLIAALAGMNK